MILEKTGSGLVDFFSSLAEALEDNRLTFLEGLSLSSKIFDFIRTLKDAKEIVEEWKALTNEEKTSLVYNLVIDLKEDASGTLELRLKQFECIIKAIEDIQDCFMIENEIKEFKETQFFKNQNQN